LIRKAQPLKPDLKVKPRVYYIGLPKKFIAGAVYDPDANECAEGATVTVTNLDSGLKAATITDSYGDFWFKEMDKGSYSLLVEKEGYRDYFVNKVDVTQKDTNIGDIKIFKK